MTVDRGVAIHCDGARIWNAHVASGVPLERYGALADTMSVCLSKGLGAPVGSVVICDADREVEAREYRHRLGGAWRQAGVLAAAGLYAIEHHIERLAEDHANARHLAERIADAAPGVCDPDSVDTNIVLLDLTKSPVSGPQLFDLAKAEGVLVSVLGEHAVRLVTHLDVDSGGCARAADALARLLAGG